MGFGELLIRSYDAEVDRLQVEDLERRCEVGPAQRVFLFTDTLGDPICRIRNSPMYIMLVAVLDNELVGVIQGTIKLVTLHKHPRDLAKMGYVLGLRVAPVHRRRGIGLKLVVKLEEWFNENDVDYAYMATEKDNEASVNLFTKLGYIKFRTPAILVNPVSKRMYHLSSTVEIEKLREEEAAAVYRRFMQSTELFPQDIDNILRNKLNLGTWVAYPRGESWDYLGSTNGQFPSSWAMLSAWNSGELFKLRLGKAPTSCFMYTKSCILMDKLLPSCFKLPEMPDFFLPFGFFFIYGFHREGAASGKLMRTLCKFVHNLAIKSSKDCKVIVTEVGGGDSVRLHIPHWKLLSFPDDLWCIKALKCEDKPQNIYDLSKIPSLGTLFIDPREV
ncbi:hypothetical protein SLE2022_286220 [Rubroshorea leprosula]